MKNIYKVLFLISIMVGLQSCEEELNTKGVSSVTVFPIITLNGDEDLFVTQGEAFTDPGAVSMAGTEVLETTTSYDSGVYYGENGVDTSTPDQYSVTYSAKNSDGIDGNAVRNVWVGTTGDLVTSIEGVYLIDVQRAPSFTPSAQYNDLKHVIISKTGANTYEITHAIGGYYALGRGYGPDYAARGSIITVNDIATNDYSFTTAHISGFGLDIDIKDFIVDAATKSITYTGFGAFGNGEFKVQLSQVQF